MENMQKVVTAQDVANHVGCRVNRVHSVFAKTGSSVDEKLKEDILRAAQELGYDPKVAAEERWKNKPTMKKVAKKAGCSVSTVYNAFTNGSHCSEKMKEKIFQAATEIGFVYRKPEERKAFNAAKAKAKVKAEQERAFSLRYAGFKNREEQNEYMLAMRSTGYSNAQISRRVGLTILTVRRRIGSQPKDMTRDNVIAGQKHRAAENQRRRIYVDTHLVRTYNNMILECGQLRSQAAELVSKADELTKEITKMKPQVEKAKLSTEKPVEMPAEQLQMSVSPTSNAVLQ